MVMMVCFQLPSEQQPVGVQHQDVAQDETDALAGWRQCAHERVDAEMRVLAASATIAPRNVSHTSSQRDSSSDMAMPELKA